MRCYASITVKDGHDDETIWFEAPSREAAKKFQARLGREDKRRWRLDEVGRVITWGDGLDAIVDEDGYVTRRAGGGGMLFLRNYTRAALAKSEKRGAK